MARAGETWSVEFVDDTGEPAQAFDVQARGINGVLSWLKGKYGGGAGGPDADAKKRMRAKKLTVIIELKEGA